MISTIYRVYGMVIAADLALPHLPAHDGAPLSPDVFLHLDREQLPPPLPFPNQTPERWRVHPHICDRRLPVSQTPGLRVWLGDDDASICFDYGHELYFTFSADGRHIWAVWSPMWDLDFVTPYILNPVIGFALRLQGRTALHASGVLVAERALLLCGHSGAGKSTTAAYFAAQGHAVITDDIAALHPEQGGVRVHSGYPRLRLHNGSVEAIGESLDHAPVMAEGYRKRYLHLQGARYAFYEQPAPVGAIYALMDRVEGAGSITPLKTAEALLELTKHTYQQYLLSSAMRAADFVLLGGVARQLHVRRVVPPQGLENLSALYALITRDYLDLIQSHR